MKGASKKNLKKRKKKKEKKEKKSKEISKKEFNKYMRALRYTRAPFQNFGMNMIPLCRFFSDRVKKFVINFCLCESSLDFQRRPDQINTVYENKIYFYL